MLEETKMLQQEEQTVDVIEIHDNVPYSIVADILSEGQKNEYNAEMNQIANLYTAYRCGQEFATEGSNGDYVASQLRFKKAANIMNKEARFLFANPPTFNVNLEDVDENTKQANAILQDFLEHVLTKNNFNGKLIRAAKDCFIGKRVALVLNFNETSGITITFLNALEFVHETTGSSDELSKITTFHSMIDTHNRQDQRWFRKTYEFENGVVYVEEKLFNGLGVEIEEVTPRRKTHFTHIPAVVILNDSLTGEVKGESELGAMLDYEGAYSKLANADIDAGRKGMNPVRYTIDAAPNTTKDLSISPGSFWDLASDEAQADTRQAKVGLLEPTMAYSSALKTTLDRVENTMYSEVDVPNVNSEQLAGVITSGKTLKALYWGLIVRCDEKMLTWGPALRFMAETIIEGGRLYPKCISRYTSETNLPNQAFEVQVTNNYPLPEDVEEEKNVDLAEVNAQAMSRKAYMKKWRNLNDEEAEAELEQIRREQELLEASVSIPSGRLDAFGE